MTASVPAMLRRWRSAPDSVDLTTGPRPHRPIELDAAPQRLVLDLAATAVVVVDMQNDFCHADGWLAGIGVDVSGAAGLVPRLEALLHDVRDAAVPVIWLNWGNRRDRANLPPNVIHVYDGTGAGGGIGDRVSARSDAVLTDGSWGASVVDGLTIDPGDLQVAKYRMSGFWDTPLDSILRTLGIRHLLFTGVNVDQCVFATLVDAACAGYDCLLVTDAAATTSPAMCEEATHYNVRQCFGFLVDTTAVRTAITTADTQETP